MMLKLNLFACTLFIGFACLTKQSLHGATGKSSRPQARVRNGTIIEPHSMPWLVSLSGVWRCSGSIIGKRHVLTSAHCAGVIYVAVGAHDLGKLGQVGKKVPIEKFEVYNDNGGCATNNDRKCPLYGDPEYCCYQRDIAVATLAQDVLNDEDLITEKAVLGPISETDCLKCEGYCAGLYDASGYGSDPLNPQTFNFPKTTEQMCASCIYSMYGKESDQHTCAVSTIDSSTYDVCHGDSGGPLTLKGTNIIVGIVESGWHCKKHNPEARVGIYQDLLKSKVHKFIQNIVPDLEVYDEDRLFNDHTFDY